MIDSEIRRFIKEEIRQEMNVILSGLSSDNDSFNEVISQLFVGMPETEPRPVMQPFGLSSRAPKGTLQVVGRMGEHKGNRVVLGHRDKGKPTTNEYGETVLYDAYGGKIQLKQSGMEFTSQGVDLLDQLVKLITTIINARVNTIFGPQPLIPNPAGIVLGETFLQIRQQITAMKGGVSGS